MRPAFVDSANTASDTTWEDRLVKHRLTALILCLLLSFVGCNGGGDDSTSSPNASPGSENKSDGSTGSGQEKVLHLAIRTGGPQSLDPVQGSSVYDNQACSQVYETLLQYKYLKRPFELEPLLLAEMPKTEDGLTYHFKLKQGVHFQDDECFPDGKGRELVASDVFYSWKRMANDKNNPNGWWLFENTYVGFDDYRSAQNKAEKFDYDAPVDGFKIINDHEFSVTLIEPVQRFLWTLSMFQLAIVPREAVETHGKRFARHPVGTGPYRLKEGDWEPEKSLTYYRNPNYHEMIYPSEHMPEDEAVGLTDAAGTKLPIADKIEVTMFKQDQPMWLEFDAGHLDFIQVPAENFEQAFNRRTRKLKPDYRDRFSSQAVKLLDFIFIGFNMEDPLLGGNSEKSKKIRQAISLALDWDERNRTFYNGINFIYDGPIPPGLDGHPEDGKSDASFRGPDVPRAKELLAEAGYPNGEGLPVIDYYVSQSANSQEQSEMLRRHLDDIGIELNVHLVSFPTLMQDVDNKKAQMFAFAWGSDYPDAENNLQLFYGPNQSPGSNHFNYKNAEYDKFYEQIRTMPASPERTAILVKMRDMVLADAPYAGSMARTRHYLINKRIKNAKIVEVFDNWWKYLDVEE